jgi:hypothetical protein
MSDEEFDLSVSSRISPNPLGLPWHHPVLGREETGSWPTRRVGEP